MRKTKECDAFLIDTIKVVDTGKFIPGAITFCGRKKLAVLQWKEHLFDTQEKADTFVREHFQRLGIKEAGNEGELRRN
jgi:hypothetical protein